ncbi:hypothetical protein EB796_006986 [Bugula neritina]|uniref:Uncharacterized protein n=1 Tax=Bugula neritina TaxID=10212 RepID=A0A7J7KAW4_BUGNE|nr:hypothetical protein EB796_006986 [Bugula neritina]
MYVIFLVIQSNETKLFTILFTSEITTDLLEESITLKELSSGVQDPQGAKEQPKAAKSGMATKDQPKSGETSSAAEITLASVMYACLILSLSWIN